MEIIQEEPINGQCNHCQDPVLSTTYADENGHLFCCQGCQVIYECLHDQGLSQYYQLLHDEGKKARRSTEETKLAYLKDKQFLASFNQSNSGIDLYFYVEGIECLACSWIFDNVSTIEPDAACEFSLADNLLHLTANSLDPIEKVLIFLEKMGYKLTPLKDATKASAKHAKQNRESLIKIGVAAAVLMNLMIYSIALYAGVDSVFRNAFRHFLAIIFLPIPFYCSVPFYRSVFYSAKSGKLSLDLPLSLSIFLGTIISYLNYFTGSDVFYFDSIAMFVFLILSVRHFLLGRVRGESKLAKSVSQPAQQVEVYEQNSIIAKHISAVKKGQIIICRKNELVPLDGVVWEGKSYVNESLITGESEPLLKTRGDYLYSGSKNLSCDIYYRVHSTEETNSYNQYISSAKFDTSTLNEYALFSQTYAKALTLSILILAVGLLFFYGTQTLALEKILALLIVCCPCALGLAIPLATILRLKKLRNRGVQVNNNKIFEKIKKAKNLYFDKTGTLSDDNFKVTAIAGDRSKYLPLLVALEKDSTHPLGSFLYKKYVSYDNQIKLEEYAEILGLGPEAKIAGEKIKIRREAEQVILFVNDQEKLKISVLENLDEQNIALLQKFSSRFNLGILTGDNETNLKAFLKKIPESLGIKSCASMSPEEKQKTIENLKDSIYVGDGLNDVFAMKSAQTSISLNANTLVNKACDVILLGGNLQKLSFFFSEVNSLHRLVLSNIFISIIYNVIGVYLVLTGLVTPLFAAIIMPISSLIVLIQTYIRTGK